MADGSGLNITTVGYGPHVHVALASSPAAVPRPDELMQRMTTALAELVAATSGEDAVANGMSSA